MGADFFVPRRRMDGHTDTTSLIVAFLNITNAPKSEGKYDYCSTLNVGKYTSVPLQAWSDPEGSRRLRFPDFATTAEVGCKIVSLTHRPPLLPGNALGIHF